MADGEFQEDAGCDGQIHVWVHTDIYKSILNCVYNPWVGDYIDPDRELDAEGVPLDIYCDANSGGNNGALITYNTVNGYMAHAAFPYANQTRITIYGKIYGTDIDPTILSVLRKPNNDKKCCCTTSTSCPCDFYYAYILQSQLGTIDPDTGISAEAFLDEITKTKFFGREWKPLFVIDNSTTERASIGNLGVEGVNDVEVFIKNFHETALYTNAGGPVGNIAGEGKNYIPTKDQGRCYAYYPDIYDKLCNMYHGAYYNIGATNSTWTFSGSKFLSTAVPTDFINGGGKFCSIALLDKDYEYNYKLIDYNDVLITDTTFKGKVAIQNMQIGGLNNVGVGTSYIYSPWTFKNNLTDYKYEDPGLVGGGTVPQGMINIGYNEYYHECQYAGLSDFVARPFNLKSTGIFLTPILSVTTKHMKTKLPYCYYDSTISKYVAYPVDPNNPVYMYNTTVQFKPQLGSITITEL